MISPTNNSPVDKLSSYTANGNKYFYHPEQMQSLLNDEGHSVITASIAPTNACNLRCSYCNQSDRQRGISLPLGKIQDFVNALKERGLKAVILAGGGEPTIYRDFNKLVNWLKKDKELAVALITNGTNDKCGNEPISTWDSFDWIRVSINFLNEQMLKLKIPKEMRGKVGMSVVYTDQSKDLLRQVSDSAMEYDARFVRVIPDFFKSSEKIAEDREKLKEMIADFPNRDRFFIQKKTPTHAKTKFCFISKIKPFLLADGKVATCDCFMNNKDENGEFFGGNLPDKFNTASDPTNPASYVDYLDGKHKPGFNPQTDCNGCGYIVNNQILQNMMDIKELLPDANINEIFEKMGFNPTESIIRDKDFV